YNLDGWGGGVSLEGSCMSEVKQQSPSVSVKTTSSIHMSLLNPLTLGSGRGYLNRAVPGAEAGAGLGLRVGAGGAEIGDQFGTRVKVALSPYPPKRPTRHACISPHGGCHIPKESASNGTQGHLFVKLEVDGSARYRGGVVMGPRLGQDPETRAGAVIEPLNPLALRASKTKGALLRVSMQDAMESGAGKPIMDEAFHEYVPLRCVGCGSDLASRVRGFLTSERK
ncbi:unnamed protein product, partial [Choristocarpus tenellus]